MGVKKNMENKIYKQFDRLDQEFNLGDKVIFADKDHGNLVVGTIAVMPTQFCDYCVVNYRNTLINKYIINKELVSSFEFIVVNKIIKEEK
jgi:hypothetical protein